MSDRTYLTADGVTLKPGDTFYAAGYFSTIDAHCVSADRGWGGCIPTNAGVHIAQRRAFASFGLARADAVAELRYQIGKYQERIAVLEAVIAQLPELPSAPRPSPEPSPAEVSR